MFSRVIEVKLWPKWVQEYHSRISLKNITLKNVFSSLFLFLFLFLYIEGKESKVKIDGELCYMTQVGKESFAKMTQVGKESFSKMIQVGKESFAKLTWAFSP